MKVDVSAAARADLDDIVDYIAAERPASAYEIVESLRRFVTTTLPENPEIGRRADHLDRGVRVFIKGNYRICYRVQPDTLQIIRFVHYARDIDALFR